MLYQNLTEDDEKEIILRDNINNGQWDPMGLQSDYFAEVDFNFMGLEISSFGDDDEEEPKKKKSKKAKEEPQDPDGEESDEESDEETDDKEAFYNSMLNDCLYESNNIFDIPNLLIEKQAGKLLLPFAPWGLIAV